VSKVRITGGEPLVRKNALWLFEEIGEMPGIDELVTTTNGSQLEQQAQQLKNAGVRRINISLDTLKADRFKQITRAGDLAKVLRGIQAAKEAGFDNIKLNVVLMRDVNDDETLDLVNFAIDQGLDISFIEEMPIGEVNHSRDASFISNQETLTTIQKHFSIVPSTQDTGGPARYWQIANNHTKIGFISPHSHNFCESCNRVRISCKGELFLCLGQEDKIELLPILRANPNNDAPIVEAIINSMKIKPQGHDFDLKRPQPAVVRFMSHTGG
jgi:cyclic pyranopterin phosphate synthase